MTHGATARLFVALDLPVEVRTQLVGWARRCAGSLRAAAAPAAGAHEAGAYERRSEAGRALPGRRRSPGRGHLRLLGADTLHVTLCFLGSRPVGETEAIGQALAGACATAPPLGRLELGAPLWLPPRRPRALAVELHDDVERRLEGLHLAVAGALSEIGGLEPEPVAGGARRGAGGRFRPHITVARMRAGDAPRERLLPATPALAFSARALTLYRSWLTPTEAEYEALASYALAAPTG
jgi:RNA 2',3'-cyclic 3'-phosphodiesterase